MRESPAAGRSSATGARRDELAVGPLLLGAILAPIDYFVVNLALPAIRAELSASGGLLPFVISAYATAYAVGLIPGGRLGDRFGRKRLFTAGLASFVGASAVCGLATDVYVLIAGRFLQGLAASMLSPQVLATFRAVLPERRQTPVIAAYGFVFGLGAVIGQAGGGLLLQSDVFGLGWRAIFWINVPIGLLALAGARAWMRESTGGRTGPVDIAGVVWLCVLIGLVLVPLSVGRSVHWPWWAFVCLAAAAPLAWWFVRFQRRRTAVRPLLNIELIRRPVVWRGLLLAFFFYTDSLFFMGFGIYTQDGLGWSASSAALLFLPFSAGFILGPLIVPRLVAVARERTVPVGFTVISAGFALQVAALLRSEGPDAVLFAGLVVAGIGHGLVLSSLTRVLMMGVETRWAGQISSLVISSMQIGSASGVAGFGPVLFAVLGDGTGAHAYSIAFGVSEACLTAALLACLLLSFSLARELRVAHPVPTRQEQEQERRDREGPRRSGREVETGGIGESGETGGSGGSRAAGRSSEHSKPSQGTESREEQADV
ncbi:putative MFS family arabinose efflux permease [Streptomyces sp. Amel2xB2]|uniref:MFS transporter n=1 Tax=Streptomyces sp. Amel2xB2 TaxID=1305829 RepID=UPI000DBA9D9E|nr:MFS transporter [Streptomyces sp. Amel2xB2]RAJ58761.1 putative MFS family arabinose efflux permease [Streptomyces sp. Amel2xB2]